MSYVNDCSGFFYFLVNIGHSGSFKLIFYLCMCVNRYFQFGWTGTPDLANSIAMERLPLPSLLVVNATTMHHHLPEDPPHHLTPQAIQIFLDSIIATSAPVSV